MWITTKAFGAPHVAVCFLAFALMACGSKPSTSTGGATGGASGFQVAAATGGASGNTVDSDWSTARGAAPRECEQDDYEVLANTYVTSRFVIVGGSLFVTYPNATSNQSQTDLDEIRLSPYGKRTVYSGDGYSASVASSAGQVFFTIRPWDMIYSGEDKATYKVFAYDPSTSRSSVLVDGYALVVTGSPSGVITGGTDYAQVELYPNDGSNSISLCKANGADTFAANSTAVLIDTYRSMVLCSLDGSGSHSFVPYPEYDGVSLRSFAVDDQYAYLVHQAQSTADGIYRLDLSSQIATRIATGSYELIRNFDNELWLTDTTGGIYRMPSDGSSAPVSVTNQGAVVQLEVDENYVYFTRNTSDSIACIKRMPKT